MHKALWKLPAYIFVSMGLLGLMGFVDLASISFWLRVGAILGFLVWAGEHLLRLFWLKMQAAEKRGPPKYPDLRDR